MTRCLVVGCPSFYHSLSGGVLLDGGEWMCQRHLEYTLRKSEEINEALTELVRLKDLKDVDPIAYEAEGEAKESAWTKAREALGIA